MSQTAILDIGSSKVVCLICGTDGRESIIVHGAGIREYAGYKHGELTDEKELSDAIIDALAGAEAEAKRRVRDISVGVPAPFVKLDMRDGTVTFKKARRIQNHDVDELINASLECEAPEGFELISSTPVDFTIDGDERSVTPIGMIAQTMSARVSHMYVEARFKKIVSDALGRAGLDADMFIAVPLSEGLFVIPQNMRDALAVMIDVGGTHTDVCLIHNAALVDIRTIHVGGTHFTSDLCYGLGVKDKAAENVKRRYVYSLDYQDSIDVIRLVGGGTLRVEHEAIQYIIEERTRELAHLILEAISEMGALGAPVYLTGGGISLMRGSSEFLEKELGFPVNENMPWMPRMSSPNYASAFSIMDFVMHSLDEDSALRLEGNDLRRRAVRKLRDIFKI